MLLLRWRHDFAYNRQGVGVLGSGEVCALFRSAASDGTVSFTSGCVTGILHVVRHDAETIENLFPDGSLSELQQYECFVCWFLIGLHVVERRWLQIPQCCCCEAFACGGGPSSHQSVDGLDGIVRDLCEGAWRSFNRND
jgi:hypothetical protein